MEKVRRATSRTSLKEDSEVQRGLVTAQGLKAQVAAGLSTGHGPGSVCSSTVPYRATEPGTTCGQERLKDQECFAGHVNSETPSRHPSGDVRQMAGMSASQGKGGDGGTNGKVVSTE